MWNNTIILYVRHKAVIVTTDIIYQLSFRDLRVVFIYLVHQYVKNALKFHFSADLNC